MQCVESSQCITLPFSCCRFLPVRDPNSSKNRAGEPPLNPQATLRTVPVADWLLAINDAGQRHLTLLQLVVDILSVLQLRHDNGIVCSDLSEETIRIRLPERVGVLVETELSTYSNRSMERAIFLAPEQTGALQRPLGPYTDLYSLGVFLYRWICGAAPIQASNLSELMLGQMTKSVASVRWKGHGVTRCVDEFILRLLRRDPRDRYQSAKAALADLINIVDLLQGKKSDAVVLGCMDKRERLCEPSLVGRDSWLDRFVHSLADLAAPNKRWFILSKPGDGKTRLISEFAKEAMARAAIVVRMTGVDSENARPLQAFASVSSDLEEYCRSHPELVVYLADGLSQHEESIRPVFPWMFQTQVQQASAGPEKFAGQRLKRAIEALMDLLNLQNKRTVLLVDNLDCIDELSRDLLAGWLQSRKVRQSGSLLFVATGSLSSEMRLQPELGLAVEVLQPLMTEGITAVLKSMIGQFPLEALDLTAGASNGNPFLAISLLQGIIESGVVQFREGSWSIRPGEPLKLQSHGQGSSALITRTMGLPDSTVSLLRAGAILGKGFEFREARLLSGIDSDLAQEALELAVQRQLVWTDGHQRQAGFVHDDIRRMFLGQLNNEAKCLLHQSAARLILEENAERYYELAHHYDAAECRDEAIHFSTLAAKHAQRQYANDLAIRYYRMAQKWIPASNRDRRRMAAESIGEVFLSTGDYDAAGVAFAESLSFADQAIDRTQLAGKLGDVEFKRGRMSQAAEQYVAALALSGFRVPHSVARMLLGLICQSAIQGQHSLLGLSSCRKAATPLQRLRWTLFSRLAHTYWFSRGAVWTLFAHLSGMNDAERYLDTPELAKSYSEHAPVCSLLRLFRRADAYSKRSLKIRCDQKDLWGQGQTLAYASVVHLAAARFQTCVSVASEGIELLERTGDAWETNMARYQRANALYRAGRFREAANDAKRIHDSGIEIGDDQAAGISLDVWMRSAPHQVAPEIVATQARIHRTDAQSHAQTHLALAIVQLRAEQFVEAEATLRGAIERCKTAGHLNSYISPCYAWLATALRTLASSTPRYQVKLFHHRIAEAQRAAKIALKIAKKFPADLPQAWREIALMESLTGRSFSASKLFRNSIKIAEILHSPMQAWESLKCLSQLVGNANDSRLQLTQEEAERLESLTVDLADSIRCIEGNAASQESISLADRFDTLLADGRRITRSLDKRDIFRESCLAAQHLLRGQVILILSREHKDPSWTIPEKIATGVVAQALIDKISHVDSFLVGVGNGCESRILPWDDPDRFTKGSLLVTPIQVRESIVAYLLVGHVELDNLFGNEELKVAEFIATLTGAAMENAEGFDELHKLNSTLEQRVEERTAAAELRSNELVLSNDALRETEEQLRDAIEVANAASQAKSRFLATMSHEIRTPLNGILGMTQLALANSPNPQLTNYLKTISRSGDSLLRLLNDLLDFSKIEAGKMTVETIAFDPREVFADAVELLAIPAWQKGIEIVASISPNLPSNMIGDPVKLRQIILNLLGNAIKFTSVGYVEMRVEVATVEASTWKIHVIDTGIGIPEDKQKSIFEAFSQADNSTTRRFGGTGLGLSISTELVRLMNGTIEVASQSNVGSEFTITLPLIVDTFIDPSRKKTFKLLIGRKFLIVDPCDAARRCLEQTVTECGGLAIGFNSWFDQPSLDRPDLELFDAVIAAGTHAKVLLDDAKEQSIPGWLAQGPNATQHLKHRYLVKPCIGPEWLNDIVSALSEVGSDSPAFSSGQAAFVANPAQNSAPKTSNHSNLNILVAEDGLVNQCVLVGLLELTGHTATVANNGREAAEIVEKCDFDICLMDLDMPELDGVEATRLIRSRGIALPIYAMTAHHDQHHADLCREAGMNGFLTKPIKPNDLQRILAEVSFNRVSKSVARPL